MTSSGNPDHPQGDPQSERWGTRLGVILAVSGSAVGLGNFLRFPGQAVQHGGGAFMIPYFAALLVLGIPLAWVEWTLGRYGGRYGFHSAPGILGVATRGRLGRYVGCLGLLVPIIVYMYYVLIEAWCLRYAWEYLVGGIQLGDDTRGSVARSKSLFQEFSGSAGDGILGMDGDGQAFLFWAIVMALNLWFVHRGLSRGVEAFCRWAMPAMAVCAVLVLIRVLTLGTPDAARPEHNVVAGLGFLWNPDLSKLGEFGTWLAAAGQVFFTLSAGFGVITTYASYLTEKDDVVLSGLTACATNELFEVGFGGLITVTAAFVFLGASGAAGGVFGLGFQTLPVVFGQMGGAGRVFGVLWFGMLFLAAVTSSLSMLQPFRAFLREGLGLGFRASTLVIACVVGVGSLWVFYFSGDLVALDTMDFWVGTLCIFALATLQVLIFGWIFGADAGIAEANRGADLRLPRALGGVIRFVAPAYLLVVLVGFAVQELPGYAQALLDKPVALSTLLGIALLLGLAIVATGFAERRWRSLGLPLDGPPTPELGSEGQR